MTSYRSTYWMTSVHTMRSTDPHLGVEGEEPVEARLRVEVRFHALARGGAQRMAQRLVEQQRLHRPGELGRTVRPDEEPGDAVDHELRSSADERAHHRAPRAHGLEDDPAQRIRDDGGDDDHVGGGVEG